MSWFWSIFYSLQFLTVGSFHKEVFLFINPAHMYTVLNNHLEELFDVHVFHITIHLVLVVINVRLSSLSLASLVTLQSLNLQKQALVNYQIELAWKRQVSY